MKMVSVAEILKKVTCTADCYFVGEGPHEWFRLIQSKMYDRQTPAIIRAIQNDGFNVPICIEVMPGNVWRLGNGHHRLAIAILLGLDFIPVDFSGWFTSDSSQNTTEINKDYKYNDSKIARWIAYTAVSDDDLIASNTEYALTSGDN